MIGTVEQFVADFQEGNESAFSDIYNHLENTRSECIRRLRRKLPSMIGDADIEALFDDAILVATNSFQQDKGCSFVTFLKMTLEQRSKNLMSYINAEKRQADYYHVSLSATNESDDGSDETDNLLATLVDEKAINAEDNLQCSALMDSLKEFRKLSKKNREYADLIIYDSMVFESREEKHAAIQAMMGVSVKSSAIHKRVKRAKKAFKEYFEETQKNN